MEIRAAMIENVLLRNGQPVDLSGDPESVVSIVRTHRRGPLEKNVLYVSCGLADSERVALAKKAPIINWDVEFAEGSTETADVAGCVERTYDAILAISAWESRLKDGVLHGVTLNELIELGRQMIPYPLAYIDQNLITLAATPDYWGQADASASDAPDGNRALFDQMPPQRAADLVKDSDYLHAAEKREGFYYEDMHHRVYYGINTFDDDEYRARLMIALPDGLRNLQRGEEQLVGCLHSYLKDLHLRYAGNASVIASQNDAIHVFVRACITASEVAGEDKADIALASRGWKTGDAYVVTKLVFFEGAHWDSVSLYLCGLLERMMDESCALPLNRQIVWLVNLTGSAHGEETEAQVERRFIESLVGLLRNYAFKAGLSDVFTQLRALRSYYREAERSLELGQERNPHYWYYWFRDYAFDNLLSHCGEDLLVELSCHPAFNTLKTHDDAHGTEHVRTLVCYLRNNQSATHAAQELFIHRTTFIRRLAQIEKIAHISFDEPDEVLHLLLSAKLLGL